MISMLLNIKLASYEISDIFQVSLYIFGNEKAISVAIDTKHSIIARVDPKATTSTLATHKIRLPVFQQLTFKCSDKLKSVYSQWATSQNFPNVIITFITRTCNGLTTAHNNLIFVSRLFPSLGSGLENRKTLIRFPSSGQRYFSSSQHWDGHWLPLSLLFNGNRRLSSQIYSGRCVKLTTRLNHVPRLGISEAILPFPHVPLVQTKVRRL